MFGGEHAHDCAGNGRVGGAAHGGAGAEHDLAGGGLPPGGGPARLAQEGFVYDLDARKILDIAGGVLPEAVAVGDPQAHQLALAQIGAKGGAGRDPLQVAEGGKGGGRRLHRVHLAPERGEKECGIALRLFIQQRLALETGGAVLLKIQIKRGKNEPQQQDKKAEQREPQFAHLGFQALKTPGLDHGEHLAYRLRVKKQGGF